MASLMELLFPLVPLLLQRGYDHVLLFASRMDGVVFLRSCDAFCAPVVRSQVFSNSFLHQFSNVQALSVSLTKISRMSMPIQEYVAIYQVFHYALKTVYVFAEASY